MPNWNKVLNGLDHSPTTAWIVEDTNNFTILVRFNPAHLRRSRERLEAAYDCGCGWGDYCDANDTEDPASPCVHNMRWVQDQLLK